MEKYGQVMTDTLYIGRYIPLYTDIAKKTDVGTAALYGVLVNSYMFFRVNRKLSKDGFCFVEVKYVENLIGMGAKSQRSSLEKLKSLGLIEVDYRGLPKRRWIKINDVNIEQPIMVDNLDIPEDIFNYGEDFYRLHS